MRLAAKERERTQRGEWSFDGAGLGRDGESSTTDGKEFHGEKEGEVKKTLAILIIFEDILAPIAAIHHMIDRSFIFNSQLPRHSVTLAEDAILCQ